MLWALKPHEDGIEHGIITRFWNVSPESQDFSLKLANGIAKAFKSTHIETEPLAAEVISKELPVKARSWQMLTYVVQPGKRN
jgi:alpha-mannosidase